MLEAGIQQSVDNPDWWCVLSVFEGVVLQEWDDDWWWEDVLREGKSVAQSSYRIGHGLVWKDIFGVDGLLVGLVDEEFPGLANFVEASEIGGLEDLKADVVVAIWLGISVEQLYIRLVQTFSSREG